MNSHLSVTAAPILLCTELKSGFWRMGREKLLEMCVDTVSAPLKVHLFRLTNVLSSSNTRIFRSRSRFPESTSLIYSPQIGFVARLDLKYSTASVNPPQKTNPSDAYYNKRKKNISVLHALSWSALNAGCREAIGSGLNSRNNRRSMNKSRGKAIHS